MKLIDGRTAQIEWNDDRDHRVADLVVFDRTAVGPEYMARSEKRFAASHGACVGDWMSGERAVSSPEGQFIGRVRDGFASPEVMLEVLDQFGQIREAGWARTMARALRERLIQEAGGADCFEDRPDLLDPLYE